jgi:hypothetical protein
MNFNETFLHHYNNCNLPALCKRMCPDPGLFLSYDGMCLEYIHKRTPEMLALSLKTSYGMSLKFFTAEEKTSDLIWMAIHLSKGYCIDHIPYPTDDMLNQILKYSPNLLRRIKNPSYSLVKNAVVKDWNAVNCVKDKGILRQLALDGFKFPKHTLIALDLGYLQSA